MGAIRKIFTTGVGAALMTENTLRTKLAEMNLTQQARDYLNKALAGEVKRFLNHINLHRELQKALTGLTLEVEAKVKIVGPGDRLQVKDLRLRRLEPT